MNIFSIDCTLVIATTLLHKLKIHQISSLRFINIKKYYPKPYGRVWHCTVRESGDVPSRVCYLTYIYENKFYILAMY